jgi:energy-coupling factor transport system ATP-binding protein
VSLIECVGLGYVYPSGVRALDGLDLTIGPGELVGIVGQNGSGKSTLARHFNGLLRPTAGRVLVDGRDTRTTRVAHLAAIVGLGFQDPDQQIFAGSVRAEVEFGPRNLGLRGKSLSAAVDGALETVGLEAEAKANPYDLGQSRRKLLSIASVLAMGTPVVILDEPATGQDQRGVARVIEIIRRLGEEGRTVVAISHDMRFVAEAVERVIVLREGALVLDGATAEVFAEPSWPILESTYLEPPLPARLGARIGLGSTPTDAAFVAALQDRSRH